MQKVDIRGLIAMLNTNAKKAKLFNNTITNEVKYNLFATPAPDKANLFYTGAAFNSICSSQRYSTMENVLCLIMAQHYLLIV